MKNLYTYVNGPWLQTHTIPADRGVDGTFHALRDEAEADVHSLIQEDTGRPGTLFSSFMDVEGISAAGLDALAPDLDRLEVKSIEDFARALGELERDGIGGPLTFWVEKDSDGENAVPYLVQSGLGLPDEAYYRADAHVEVLTAYRRHIARMLGFLPPERLDGVDTDTAAERILLLETELAEGHWDVVTSRDAVKTYNPMEVSDLPEIIQALLAPAGLPEGRVIAMMPPFIEHLAELLTQEKLADWKLWGAWHVLRSRAGVLPEPVGAANFEFYGTQLSGATEQRDRWKRGVALVESLVGEDMGKVFVRTHFPPEAKEDMLNLVGYLTRAYEQRIKALEWMTEETKEKALIKLSQFKAKIGYPDVWRDYSALSFEASGEKLLENVRAASAFVHDYEVAKIGKPANRDEWVTTPQTVNAFYNPVVNDITFPAAILRPPFYSPAASAAENFGGIGAVIGHEIGHGFDDQGSQYDGHGNLKSWWSQADRDAFTTLTNDLVTQFDGLVPSVLAGTDSAGVNGHFTLGENIGDLGGLGIAVVAYEQWVADNGPEEDAEFQVEGADPDLYGRRFTGLQRLFLSWARVWRTAIRPEMAQQYLSIDPHSPAEFRCNQIVANIDEFYQAFEVDEDSPMFIPTDERVTIW